MQLLKAPRLRFALALGEDRSRSGGGTGHRRHAGNTVADGGGSDLVAVAAGPAAGWRVDHEVHLVVSDVVHDVRGALADLVDRLNGDAHARDRLGGAAG